MKNVKNLVKIAIFCFTLLHAVSSTPQLHKGSDGRNYLIETAYQYNWYQAWHECARRGYELVVIDSAAKNNVVTDLLKKVVRKSYDMWLGGNDEHISTRGKKRQFYWSPTGENFNFSFWSDYNPANLLGNEHCVHISFAEPLFQWNDVECTTKMGFICEVNHFYEKYQKDVQRKCEAVTNSSSSISNEFSKAWKQHASELDKQNKLIDDLSGSSLGELHMLHASFRNQIQAILTDLNLKATQLSEKLFKKVSALQSDLQKSIENGNTQFSAQLSVKLNQIKRVC